MDGGGVVRTPGRGLAAAAVFLISASAAAQEADPAANVAAGIRGREAALAEAMHAGDRSRLEQLLARDYSLRGSPDIDRETWIRNAVTLCWGDRSDIEGFRVRQYGQVVIASFELTFYVDPATCRSAVLRSLITDVWVHEPDGWKLRVRHAGPPPTDSSIAAQYGFQPEAPPTWEVSNELSLVATSGNTSTRTLGVGSQVTHQNDARSTHGSFAFLSSEADAVTRARSLTVQIRHAFRLAERLDAFGEVSYARDRFAGIDHRIVATAGIARTVSLPPRHVLRVQGGAGMTAERRLDATNLRRHATATGALHYGWTFAPRAELTEDAAVDADLQSAGNWRGTGRTALSVTLTRLLSLKVSNIVEYRNAPVAGFRRTDMRMAAALVMTLQRRPRDR